MRRLFFVPAVGFALALSASAAQAQVGGWRDSAGAGYTDDRQPYYEARRGAYDNGYREGIKQGEHDGKRHDAYSFRDERTWQRADKGYDRSYGDVDRYRQQFRVGYEAGYQNAYNQYGGGYSTGGRAVPRYPNQYPGGYYPNQGSYPNGYPTSGRYGYNAPAYPNGVNDGIEKGREDARKQRSYDPSRHSWYRDGDHDYKSQYGQKQTYETTYRDGFREGYDRGYREGNYGYYGR